MVSKEASKFNILDLSTRISSTLEPESWRFFWSRWGREVYQWNLISFIYYIFRLQSTYLSKIQNSRSFEKNQLNSLIHQKIHCLINTVPLWYQHWIVFITFFPNCPFFSKYYDKKTVWGERKVHNCPTSIITFNSSNLREVATEAWRRIASNKRQEEGYDSHLVYKNEI